MRILYVDWNMYGKQDIIDGFSALGHEVICTDIPLVYEGDREKLEKQLDTCVKDLGADIAFTSNYYPVVSNICEKYKIKYISWVYDNPLISLYDKSIVNSCNYVFMFDSAECKRLQNMGICTVFYMPLAVNPKRLDKIEITKEDKRLFSSDVSIVASLYNEKHNLYDRMAPKLSKYTRGYLEGLMDVQKSLFGGFILEEPLYKTEIISDMYKALPYQIPNESFASQQYVYANYFLARKTAYMQRTEYISELSKCFDMKVYSGGDLSSIPLAKHMGTVDYMTDMNKVFRLSKINLNITLPSIQSGIPLRAMDIMGNGGFLLTNYQKDMFDFFEPEVDFVYYTSLDEAKELISYYLEHEDERKCIAANAKEKMTKYHSFEDRIKDTLYIVENA
ncbi:MAG: DUF3880 domain-containing protein [Eubacteriales bacterium]|nr:DUF3880 domain-containing protein [Eubacteriales bacterium]